MMTWRTALLGICLGGLGTTATAQYGTIIPYRLSGFSKSQEAFLGEVLQLVADRMLDPRMLTAAESILSGPECHQVRNRVRVKLGVPADQVLRTQLRFLRAFEKFPFVLLEAYDNTGDKSARSDLETILFESDGSYRGSFRIQINRLALQPNADKDEWAGIIVHEMLHGLGHLHPGSTRHDRYGRCWAINAFQAAIACNGDTDCMTAGKPAACAPIPEEITSTSVAARSQDGTVLRDLDWGLYKVEASGLIDYSGGRGTHVAPPHGDYRNSKRVERRWLLGQLLIITPDGAITPYQPGGVYIRIDRGDAIRLVVADTDVRDNEGSFSVSLKKAQ